MPQCGEQELRYPEIMMQTCPLCGERQPIYVSGLVHGLEDYNQMMPVLDRGYSFCNCNNIFFTDWNNIDQRVYNESYRKRYLNEITTKYLESYANYFPRLKKLNENIKTFSEIGCINEAVLNKAKLEGWETIGIDINPNVTSENHKIVIWDVEQYKTDMKFDVIWASHIFEHFKDPLKVAENLYGALNENGLLFVAMPDPWFINWEHPHRWQHWVMREHHILWDMDSFIECMEKIGYKCVMSKRNQAGDFVCSGDFHLLFMKGNNA
jgi:predicted SAM-dependent methyltransferase